MQFLPTVGLKQAALWPVMVMSLTGLDAAAVLGGEIENPRRLPAALVFAAVLVIGTKVLGTLAVLVAIAIPSEDLGGSGSFMQAVDQVSARAGVGGLLPVVALLVVIGHVGKVGAWSATGARLPMAAGLDRTLPGAFARIHPRWGSPYVALLFQSAVVAVLVVVGQLGTSTKGAYDVLLSMTLIPTFVPFLFLFAAAIKVVWQERGRKRRRAEIAVLTLGLATTAGSTALAVIPPSGRTQSGAVRGEGGGPDDPPSRGGGVPVSRQEEMSRQCESGLAPLALAACAEQQAAVDTPSA